MIIPHQRYVTWLLLEGQDLKSIQAHLDDLSLPELPESVYTEIQTRADSLPITPALRRRLSRKTPWNTQDQAFLEKLGYGEIYEYRAKNPALSDKNVAHWQEGQSLLSNPTIRIAAECALIAGVTPEELSPLISHHVGAQLTEEGLQLYQKYFFDAPSMSRTDWRTYIGYCANNPYVYTRYQTALLKPKEEVLYTVGLPTKTQFGQFLGLLLNTASYKFQHYSAHNRPESDTQARHWAKLGMEAGVRAEKFATSDVTDFAKAIQAEFDYIDTQIPTVEPEMLASIKPKAEDALLDKPTPPPVQPTDPENF